jgi:hypothetical protein
MKIRDRLYLFEKLCYNHCTNHNKDTICFNFTNRLKTVVAYHIKTGFAMFDDHGWFIGKEEDMPGSTSEKVMNTLECSFVQGTLNTVELEKHIISIL